GHPLLRVVRPYRVRVRTRRCEYIDQDKTTGQLTLSPPGVHGFSMWNFCHARMSAFGTKRTSRRARSMSAFGGKADIVKSHNAPTATCRWKSGPRAKQGMRPLLAHEARPCSIYGEAVLEVRWRLVACLYDLRRPVAACGCGSLYATNSHAP